MASMVGAMAEATVAGLRGAEKEETTVEEGLCWEWTAAERGEVDRPVEAAGGKEAALLVARAAAGGRGEGAMVGETHRTPCSPQLPCNSPRRAATGIRTGLLQA